MMKHPHGRPEEVPHLLPLVGRATELASLAERLRRALAGDGALVLIAGEAGIGKSRLAREVLVHATRVGAYALEGTCYPNGSSIPYGPFLAALRMALRSGAPLSLDAVWLEVLRPLLPELAAPAKRGPRRALRSVAWAEAARFEGIYQLLRALARPQGVVLLLEDLHWADRTSLALLPYVVRGLAGERILLIGTYREEALAPDCPLSQALAEVRRAASTPTIRLQPLDRTATVALVKGAWPELPPAPRNLLADAIYERTGGHPFFATELLRWLVESVPRTQGPRAAEIERLLLTIPHSVQAAVAERLQALSPPARQLLAWAAVVGREFDFAVLTHLVGDETATLAALRELGSRRLVEAVDAERFRFHHAIVRDAVNACLLGPERRRLHRAVAEAIATVYGTRPGPHWAALALHYEAAGDPERALDSMVQAGQWAADEGSWREAVLHYERALALLGPAGPAERRAGLLEALADARMRLGELLPARSGYQEALEIYTAQTNRRAIARVRTKLADLCLLLLDPASAAAHCEAAQAAVTAAEAPAEAAALWAVLARVRHAQGDYAGMIMAARLATETAEPVGAWRPVCEAGCLLGYVLSETGAPGEAETWGWRALAAAERAGDPLLEVHAWRLLAYLYGAVRQDLRRGEAALQRALDAARRAGSPHQEAWVLGVQAEWSAFARGDWPQAERLVQTCEAIGKRIGVRDVVLYTWWCRGLLAYARGEHAAAEAWFNRVVAQGQDAGHWRVVWAARYQQAVMWLETGEVDRALGALQALVDQSAFPFGLARASRLAEAYLRRGELAQAQAWCERSLEASRALGFVLELAEARRVGALVAAACGDLPAAIGELEATVDCLTRLARPYDRARHQRELAALLVRCGARESRQRATALLGEAATTFGQLTARYDLALTRALAREYKLPLRVPAPQPSGGALPEGVRLTPREREVAALVAQGLSNRQIAAELVLTEGTVAVHVKNSLHKLGYRSRAQLAAWAVACGLAPSPSAGSG
jgi:DNA-binding CsgD family transcriptional regulator/tetratricopeptide (TPR) repeat protein